jgi:hypothetical protein
MDAYLSRLVRGSVPRNPQANAVRADFSETGAITGRNH